MSEGASTQGSRGGGGDKLLGRVLVGKFHLLELVARGSMGKIYRAHQLDLDREIAIKVLDVAHLPDAKTEFQSRFSREASVATKLAHPNVVTVFEYGRTEDDVYYLAMELLRGRTLAQAIRAEKRIPWQRAVDIAAQIARGLRVAHAIDVVHRDLKPANIFLVDTGGGTELTKILDFGIAKLTRPTGDIEELTQVGAFMGSARYACPEQIRASDLDGRADIYALGIILYELITGRVPYDGPNDAATLVAHMRARRETFREAAPDLDVPAEVERVIFKCFEREREDRFATVDELLQALKSASGLSELLLTGRIDRIEPPPPVTANTSSNLTPAPFAAAAAPKSLRARALAHGGWLGRRPPTLLVGGVVAGVLVLGIATTVGLRAAATSGAEAADSSIGQVQVTVTAGSCHIAIDGVGAAPSTSLPMPPIAVSSGMHTVTCTRTDGRVLAQQVRVHPGETATARFGVD